MENHLVYVGNDWETVQSLDARVKAPALLMELGGRVHNKTGICITGWIIFYLYAWNLDRWKSEFDTIGTDVDTVWNKWQLLCLYFPWQNYRAPNIDFIDEKTATQKGEIMSKGHILS